MRDSYLQLKAYIDALPVIESHEHNRGPTPPETDVFRFLLGCYYSADFRLCSEKAYEALQAAQSFEEKKRIFLPVWRQSCSTAYAQALQRAVSAVFGVGDIAAEGELERLAELVAAQTEQDGEALLARFGIAATVTDQFDNDETLACLKGQLPAAKQVRFAFSVWGYHYMKDRAAIERLQRYLPRPIETLADYLTALEAALCECVQHGAVAIKDQSAYDRDMAYADCPAEEAARLFASLAAGETPTEAAAKRLSGHIFYRILGLAEKYDLPVQLHTGQLAGLGGDVRQADAMALIPTLRAFPRVRFDLFHGNWPFMEHMLALAKSFANVWLDLCWVQCIDPVYSIELMKRAATILPMTRVFAFGGDSFLPQMTVGYLLQAKQNAALALSQLADDGLLSVQQAKDIAYAWFYGNAAAFFALA